MGLENSLTVLILTEVKEELVHRLSELLVLRVSVELLANVLELVGDAVSVSAVAAAKEAVAIIIDLVPLLIAAVFEDEALLLESLADELVDASEPVPELWILVGVLVDLVDGLDEVIK